MLSAIFFNLDQSKILSSGNVLTLNNRIQSFDNIKKDSFENKGENLTTNIFARTNFGF